MGDCPDPGILVAPDEIRSGSACCSYRTPVRTTWQPAHRSPGATRSAARPPPAHHTGLVSEDHDLHHRKGYRKAHNYGKQTRLWDRIFGTCHERIESREENVDYDTRVVVPIL